MKITDAERQRLREFAEFVDADPVAPTQRIDEAVRRMVVKDLRPALWKSFGKLTLVEAAAGLATLSVCPQFGLGFGGHNELLHGLHAAIPTGVFYLLCGVLFVILGAVLGGLVLTRQEIGAIGRLRHLFFTAYSLLAYVALVFLGPEAFAAGSLAWILGAILGNVGGFGAVIRLRGALGRG
ncbi:hypothetical protein DESUT3_31360 [Desulfuromonas versatilis]|uniref:Uncharacterized protein n=1 Tax=Desulfuromonas versatilis TaxID=2802975 RepID=A0ABN6E1L9_9BACT|nr:hypothetical protein [Desulfuromonas versatilis]BCR06067.1 hypothetical protein DESUT3_31360 [Desulfuromonas versatilis]